MSAAVQRALAEFRAARGSCCGRSAPRGPAGVSAASGARRGTAGRSWAGRRRCSVSAEAGGSGVRRQSVPEPRLAAASAGPSPPAQAAPVWARPLLLKVLLWAVLLALFAELELGLPYFVSSLLYWMYAGTRGPAERRPGELSAYSVFNPGCAAIPGTLTASKLERSLHYRPAAGR
ncbi:LOW QUALITY PROTEIN: SAYSvFN domain-containing protein 1 [Manacus vitellinus]|uniref:LOW QUALITY PROTEIN: SAYSvFN domain-containing protein 1 n=1 Tax=Manacus vitellinus TaxID=328815 RepID=UPI00115CC800|nr:LOW QUALITY PROTEIN: SAYSvFN domain-containing protein 1 [Manacus vitellinus]